MSDTYNTRNYAAHGGNEWVIGGKLTILEGAEVTGLDVAGGFTPAANVPESTASTVAALKDNFNTLLAALKTAGLMVADSSEEEEEDDDEDDENGGGT